MGNRLLLQLLPLLGRQGVKISVNMGALRLAGGGLLLFPAAAVGLLFIFPTMLLLGGLFLAETLRA